jgi:hypothetical protein
MKEALGSSETSVLTRATRGNIPEDSILHSHRRENLKSYMPSKTLNHFLNFEKIKVVFGEIPPICIFMYLCVFVSVSY